MTKAFQKPWSWEDATERRCLNRALTQTRGRSSSVSIAFRRERVLVGNQDRTGGKPVSPNDRDVLGRVLSTTGGHSWTDFNPADYTQHKCDTQSPVSSCSHGDRVLITELCKCSSSLVL